MLLSKGYGQMVIEYAATFRKKGLLISTRGCNFLLQAHILVRDYDSAFDVLRLMDYEEEIVRSHGMKIFSDTPVPFELLEEPINRYTVRGINHNRHIKRNIHSFVVNNTTKVTKEMQEEAQLLRDAERLTRMNEPPLPDPLFAGRNLTLEAERNPRTVPEFGVNLHTCISLIFNPYINLASRANYVNKKDVSLPLTYSPPNVLFLFTIFRYNTHFLFFSSSLFRFFLIYHFSIVSRGRKCVFQAS